MVDINVLKKLHFFSAFTEDELKIFSERLNEQVFQPGAPIFHENQIGDEAMYIVAEGAIKITKKNKTGEKVLANIKDGDFFGEMSMLMPAPRSASASAIKLSKCIRFSDRDYNDFKKTQPAIVIKLNEVFIRTLIQRLRDADKHLVKDGYGIGAL
ncbi:MAG: cyclic nucleotide-binding domain-containing protein [Spirochaetia bacterium]|nr:cyclic nucleotide-binding domain-containing protein [Spirochaetia bacterium]